MAVDTRQGEGVTRTDVLAAAKACRYLGDRFDTAVAGFADLVAAGRYDDADRVAALTFRNWNRVAPDRPEWAEAWLAASS